MTQYGTMVSGDSHIFEYPDMWEKALGDKFGDEIPHHMSEYLGKKGNYYYTGRQVLIFGDTDSEHRESGWHMAGYEPDIRVKFQKEANVKAEILYPSYLLVIMRSKHFEALKACAEVYNDWLREFFSHDPARLIGIGVIPLVDVDWAIKEMERCIKMGFRGVAVNCRAPQGSTPYRDKMYDPFWARAAEMGVPVTLHSITGWVPDPLHPHTPEEFGEAPRTALDIYHEIQGTLAADFIFGGIFDRHPSLKIICSEFELSWMNYFLWRIDMLQTSFAKRLPLPKLELPKASDYVRQRTWHGWIDDGHGAQAVETLGADRVLWGSDFPHVRSVGVNAHGEVAKLLDGLSADDQAKIVGANTAALYDVA